MLKKQIPFGFELVPLNLDGEQVQPEFTEINPLQRVPVIIEDEFRVVESLAILDCLVRSKLVRSKLVRSKLVRSQISISTPDAKGSRGDRDRHE
ncbi:glutathione S-transferase family protein [Leptothermofonsia sp. ETS-13]|uniref:glutathione S-transferase family protein n=1 Tax=Leptothermofonsia sp. ETS-13 TaxID=3035696 RepID=UPI003BA1A0D5